MPPVSRPSSILDIVHAGAVLHGALEREVRAQRLARASWSAVGRVLGVSKQSAHRRWRYLDDFDVFIGRTDGEGLIVCHRTGAVIGGRQQAQVLEHGVIREHHWLMQTRLMAALTAPPPRALAAGPQPEA